MLHSPRQHKIPSWERKEGGNSALNKKNGIREKETNLHA